MKSTTVERLIEAQQNEEIGFLMDAVNAEDDVALFNAQMLTSLSPDQQMSYLFAILSAYSSGPDTGNEKACRRRKIVLDKLLILLKKGRLSDMQGRHLLDKMFGQLRYLSEVHADALATKIIDDFGPSFSPSGPTELAGHSKELEILGQLPVAATVRRGLAVGRGGDAGLLAGRDGRVRGRVRDRAAEDQHVRGVEGVQRGDSDE
jgi:hypothetical protein